MALKALEENKPIKCEVTYNGHIGSEVLEGNYKHTVNLRQKACTCQLLELKGILCPHAIIAFYDKHFKSKDYIFHRYCREIFLKTFDYFIQPVTSTSMWPETGFLPFDPQDKPVSRRLKRSRRKNKDKGKGIREWDGLERDFYQSNPPWQFYI